MQTAKSTNVLREIITEHLGFRFQCGYTKPTTQIDLTDKEQLVRALRLHHVFFVPLAELEQLRSRLRETLQLEILMCSHPALMLGFLVASNNFEVTASYLLDSFVIKYSEQGSNMRTPEEAVILHWNEYVTACASEQLAL